MCSQEWQTDAAWDLADNGGAEGVTHIAIRRARPMCRSCNRRPALACVRGDWRVVKHHDVCRQCWDSLMDSRKAERLAALERDRRSVGRDSRFGIVRATDGRRGRDRRDLPRTATAG